MKNKVNQQLLHMFNQLPGYWGCKDKNGVFVYVNEDLKKLIGFEHDLDCICRTDFDIEGPLAVCAESFQEQDNFVMMTGNRLRVLDIHPYAKGKWRAILFTKVPWKNEQNEIIGTILYGVELKDTAALEVGHLICHAAKIDNQKQASFNIAPPCQSIKLNTRESEVLFLFLYGKKPQYIAKMLGLSVKTIENHVLRLREKFNANTKNELLDIAINLGFGSHIPESMLKHQLSVILKE